MNAFLSWMRSASCALILSVTAHSSYAQDRLVYRSAPVKQYGLELTASCWHPIIDHVSKKSGIKLQLKIGHTLADRTAYMLAHEVEFVFSNHLFSSERDNLCWKVFGRCGVLPLRAQIVVWPDSLIHNLEQLADKSVVFTDPESLVGYEVFDTHLLSRNLPIQVLFGGTMDGAFAQLTSGKVSAVGTHTQLKSRWSSRKNQPWRVLWQSEPFEDLALMAIKTFLAKDLQVISRAFLEMSGNPEGLKVLTNMSRLFKLPKIADSFSSTDLSTALTATFIKMHHPTRVKFKKGGRQ